MINNKAPWCSGQAYRPLEIIPKMRLKDERSEKAEDLGSKHSIFYLNENPSGAIFIFDSFNLQLNESRMGKYRKFICK